MADEPKPETDMKEEKNKIAEAKTSEDKVVKKDQVTKKAEKKDVQKDYSINKSDKSASEVSQTKPEDKKPEAKPEAKKSIETKPKVKKTETVVNAQNLPISTKYSKAICRFIKNKKINDAITDLEQVLVMKKAVPMKGEIPHRKGKIMSGRFPKKASEHFIKLLKSLQANANNHEIEDSVIVEAIANIGSRPYGRFGSIRRKRTHVKIKAMEKKLWKKKI